MSHSLNCLFTHAIFSTKDRTPYISDQVKPKLHADIGGIIRELKGKAVIVNGTADHVHILLQLPALIAVADAMRVIKTNSSRWARLKWPKIKFAWQTGYAAFSVSRSNVEDVIVYIKKQEEHHKRISFQDELLAFLRKHEIPYDERYIWR